MKKISHQICSVLLAILMPFSAFGQGVYFARPAAGGGGSSYDTEVLADSPVVYYRLGESSGTSAADSSGNGRTGTYAGSSITYSVAGATTDGNTAITTASSSGAVTSVDAALTPGANSFTVEIWMKKSGASGTQILVGKYNNSGDDIWMGINASGKPVFSCKGTSVTGGTTVTDDTWRHIVGVKNGTDLKIYVNGSSDATPVAFTSSVSPGGNLALATYGFANTFDYSGSLDEFAFYMSALSSTRISDHYAAR